MAITEAITAVVDSAAGWGSLCYLSFFTWCSTVDLVADFKNSANIRLVPPIPSRRRAVRLNHTANTRSL